MSDWQPMFGYLSNRLPDYPNALSLKVNVQPETKGKRPSILLEPTDHPLSLEQRHGITLDKVLRLAEPYLHG